MNSAAQDPYSTASTQTASSADPKIRPAELDDLKAIIAIYDYAIAHTTATFDTEPRSEESQRTWFNQHGEAYPLLVAASWAGQPSARGRTAAPTRLLQRYPFILRKGTRVAAPGPGSWKPC